MLTLSGKYNSASVYTDVIEPEAISQIISMCNLESLKDAKIALMPDVHPGKGCTIGTTIKITNGKVIPNLVGSDIGCGVLVCKLKDSRIQLPKFDSKVKEVLSEQTSSAQAESLLRRLYCIKHVYNEKVLASFGTLGGGNHFLELDKDDDGNVYLTIHSGSRRLGAEVCKYYQDEAYKALKNTGISQFISYVEEDLLRQYIHDMNLACQFAYLNRMVIAESIAKAYKTKIVETMDTVHNYLSEDMILRKGAVSARKDERLAIPINMKDGVLLCTGLGNPEWNFSAPHGAGRLLSRAEAKDSFTLNQYKKVMEEAKIFTTCVSRATLDECPMVYKSLESILSNISETVTVDKIIRPIYSFKMGE